MKICAAASCPVSSRHVNKWKEEMCEIHHIQHLHCNCRCPIRFFRFTCESRKGDVCEEWVRRTNRKASDDRSRWEPNHDSVLCNAHFVNGEPSETYPHPWFNMGIELGSPVPIRRKPKFRAALPPAPKKQKSSTESEVKSHLDSVPDSCPTSIDHAYASICECDPVANTCGCASKQRHILDLLTEIQDLKDQLHNKDLKDQQDKKKSEPTAVKSEMYKSLLTDEKKVRFYTGLTSMAIFLLLLKYLTPKVKGMLYWRGVKEVVNKIRKFTRSPAKFGPQRKLCLADEFLLVLMRLRLGLLNQDLADRFGISSGHASKIFFTWIKVLGAEMRQAITIPDKVHILANLPRAFQKDYPNLKGILDCTEFFIQRPRDLSLQAMTHSDYKHHNTAKILVCITPRGRISFVSKSFGGRTSDKQIVRDSGFLDTVSFGDTYMADRGFTIREDLLYLNADLVIPPSAKGQSQSTGSDARLTKKVANLRIHIERAINRVKWFRLLQNTVPITLLPYIDDIIATCAGLTNFHVQLV